MNHNIGVSGAYVNTTPEHTHHYHPGATANNIAHANVVNLINYNGMSPNESFVCAPPDRASAGGNIIIQESGSTPPRRMWPNRCMNNILTDFSAYGSPEAANGGAAYS